jgi:two-component system LytT family sensor kinase
VLRRPNYRVLRASITNAIESVDDTSMVFAELCRAIGPSLSSPDVAWVQLDGASDPASALVTTSRDGVTRVTVPTGESPRFGLVIAPLSGGRRLLSDDVATLEAIVVAAARRIDAIRVMHVRHVGEMREREISRLATESELRALRAQINPHFLFNALTTIGYLIQTAPPRALQTLLRLTSLLRGVLRSEGEFTTLGRELDVIEAYLDIERARFEQRLRVTINVSPRLRDVRLPALVLQPIVENAVKHGVATTEAGGEVTIDAHVEPGVAERSLVVRIRDSGAGASPETLQRGRETGVGLRNVERRLQFQYGPAASLSIDSTPGVGTVVEIRLPVRSTAPTNPADQVAV